MTAVLGIGVATLDVVIVVDAYPPEDAKVRAAERRRARGGNAANTLVVLRQLGHHCAWGGVTADDPDGRWLMAELHRFGVDTRYSRLDPRGETPCSYILSSRSGGSRTIVHYRNLPEFTYEDFGAVDVDDWGWVHLEGRNVGDTLQMAQDVHSRGRSTTLSIEIEKPRPGIEVLFEHAHVLFFSRAYVTGRGWRDAEPFLGHMHRLLPDADIVCTWGDRGAYAVGRDGTVLYSPTQPPPTLVDTVGAGDTFNAGVIHALAGGGSLEAAIGQGCRLAGAKCGRVGFMIESAVPSAGEGAR